MARAVSGVEPCSSRLRGAFLHDFGRRGLTPSAKIHRMNTSHRRFAWAGTVCISTALAALTVSGQSARPAQPDHRIDGTWSFASLTPVERPERFAGKPTMTLEEARAFEREVIDRNNADRRDGGAAADIARAYNDGWYDRGTNVAILDGKALTSLVVDPPDGHIPPLTPAAQKRQQERAQWRREHPDDGPEDRSLAERCINFSAGPPMLPTAYNNNVQIYQFPDHVVIHNEMIHTARVVPTDGRAHLPAPFRRFHGDPIGRWEGHTLIVESTNFTDKSNFRGSDENLRLIEKFTRADNNTLKYEFTVDNPTAFTKPWSVVLPMKLSDEQVFEYACHEGNHGMVGILGGARYEEKQRSEGRR
jgi:hypothetical protein